MNPDKTNDKKVKKPLTEGERYRVAKYIGLNGGLLLPSIKFAAENGDLGWFILPGITTLITTPVTAKLFKKIDRRELLRILAIWAKAVAAVVPMSLAMIVMVRKLGIFDPEKLRDFTFTQVAELSIGLTAFAFLIDFWIESQAKMGEFRERGDLTDDSSISPITKALTDMTDKVINLFSKIKIDKKSNTRTNW
ncbi:MAG: hypothetical protein FWG18_02205 [Alphaproteobacteria bacterium]|nr:hypothetical protein [Alphaproteobacteria bacterium]